MIYIYIYIYTEREREREREIEELKKGWFGVVSLFNGISTFVSYSKLKPSL